jgi:hypothetical protein
LAKEKTMYVTPWNNGHHHESGAGYGIKICAVDRDSFFDPSWPSVYLCIENQPGEVEVNVAKPSFWASDCRELIHFQIGLWLRRKRMAPWPKRKPPKLELISLGMRRFQLRQGA